MKIAGNIDPLSRGAWPAGSTTPTALARADIVPVSQTQTQEVPKAKAAKKGILAGGVELSNVPELASG